MFGVVFCLGVIAIILALSKYLEDKKILKGENLRKFIHISIGCFVASWPWIIGWSTIQALSLLMLLVVFANHYHTIFKFNKHLNRTTYGDYFFALAIYICASITTNKFFFAMAILNMALADGLAAVVGKNYGKHYEYKVFGQTKSLIGTMTFWITSVYILGSGMLFAHNYIPYSNYYWVILLLPPALTLLENLSVYGSDNLVVPVTVILVLKLAQG